MRPATGRSHLLAALAAIALALLIAMAVTLARDPAAPHEQRLASSVVKVIVRSSPPDLISPWQKLGIEERIGSGVVIAGDRILTNAHVVNDAVSIEVKRASTSARVPADIQYLGSDCDLALLTVPDESFFDGVTPVRLGDMPDVEKPVQVYGYPVGGEMLSVTSGILSRVEIQTYAHSYEDLLLAQIDASVNSGNSGGPVIADGGLVGIATQSLEETDGVHYMVPVPVIRHFLDDIEDGTYHGFPKLGAEFQDLESDAQRKALGMDGELTGALVVHIDHGSPAHGVLQTGDVLLEIDGKPVANDLTIARPRFGRVHFTAAVHAKQIDDPLEVSVLRDGKRVKHDLTLTPHRFLVPGRHPDTGPEYMIFAGLLLQPLTFEYLGFLEDTTSDLLNHALYQNVVTEARRQVILIQRVLPHPINRGYQDWQDFIVETVNGVVPRDMRHLAEILETANGAWLRIETEDRSVLTLSLEEARKVQRQILDDFGIAAGRSWQSGDVLAGPARARL